MTSHIFSYTHFSLLYNTILHRIETAIPKHLTIWDLNVLNFSIFSKIGGEGGGESDCSSFHDTSEDECEEEKPEKEEEEKAEETPEDKLLESVVLARKSSNGYYYKGKIVKVVR